MYDFADKTLVLTGATGGIGRAVATLFHDGGANLVLADRDQTLLDELVCELGDGTRCAALLVDVAEPVDAERLVDLATQRFGGIDFLVPSAGIYRAEPFLEMTDAQWRQTIAINLDSVFYLCRRAAPRLRAGSAIVMLTSLAAHRGAFINAHYSASKGALLSLAKSLARELGPRTRVNSVSPGIIETPMTNALIATRGSDSVDQSALKRLGQPSEIAAAIAFLCSTGASFITGEVLHVNGGLYMAG